ncbi:hypothetical protein ACJMK2_025380 [Sinanodonta woodiana]|uniref:Uncharacterized protein n=1 Tax=Sinanodonta woodiana TaxID=1069815 RepID=A0ABD3XK40_SINWO
MAETVVAPWNLLQIAFIALYPASMSFTRMPSGMTLLALYVFLFLLCVPPIFIQLKLGNHEQRGIVGLLSTYFPIFKGVGIALLVHLFLTAVYMAPLISHYAMYAAISIIQEPYPWGLCGNAWNTPECVSKQQDDKLMTGLQQSKPDPLKEYASPESQFFNFEYLQLSDNIENISGFPVWQFNKTFENVGIPLTPIALVITWCLIFLFVAFGGRICGWILFILGPGFLSLMFVVMGYGYANLDRGPTNSFLQQLYSLNVEQLTDFSDTTDLITSWTEGFVLVMHSLPVWAAILPTMGKMTGTGKISRNISWLIVVLVYAVSLQLPQLTMAPYMGNLREMSPHMHYKNRSFSVPFTTMASAFHSLEIPHVYAFLFYLSLYIAGLMSLVLTVFTITDNVVDALTTSIDVFQNRRLCVNFFTAFVLMCLGVGAGILHTTKACWNVLHYTDGSVMYSQADFYYCNVVWIIPCHCVCAAEVWNCREGYNGYMGWLCHSHIICIFPLLFCFYNGYTTRIHWEEDTRYI